MYQQSLMAAAQDNQRAMNAQFLQRVSQLPVVNHALDYALVKYGKLKEYNGLVNYTLVTAEKSIVLAADHAKPIVEKFPIGAVDTLACKGLDTLEKNLPVISKSPEEIVLNTKNLYNATWQTGVDKYESIKSYGTEKVQSSLNCAQDLASPYIGILTKSFDGAMTLTEHYVNYCLPPAEEEVEPNDYKSAVGRVGNLSNKVRRRLHKKALKQLGGLQKSSNESLEKLKITVDFIQIAKNNMNGAGHKVNQTLNTAQQYVQWLWDEVNKEVPTEPNGPLTWDKSAILLARRLSKQIKNTYATASTSMKLPEGVQSHLNTAYKYAVEVYDQFLKVANIEELSGSVLKQIQDKLTYMEKTVPMIGQVVNFVNHNYQVYLGHENSKSEQNQKMCNSDH